MMILQHQEHPDSCPTESGGTTMNTINNDRAMKKSKTQICSALMKLLQTKPYRRITVSQICDYAGVSRPTFYKNFDTMDAVVRYKLQQIKKNYLRDHSRSGDIRALLTDFYAFVRSNPEINLLLTKGKLYYIFEDILREDCQADMAKIKEQTPDRAVAEYLPGYLSATVVSLLKKWVESGYEQTPEQMGEFVSKLVDGYEALSSPRTAVNRKTAAARAYRIFSTIFPPACACCSCPTKRIRGFFLPIRSK